MTTPPGPPRLQAGDRLTRDEFERRYRASPGVEKAELLEGVVYMPSPVRTFHGRSHALLATWLGTYQRHTPGTGVYVDTTLRLDQDNEPQPDLMLRIEGARGTSRVDDEGYVVGPPELAVEIAASSVSYDLHAKLHVYRRAGVQEYLVLRVEDRQVDWFALRAGEYRCSTAGSDGSLRSARFPGLWLDTTALLRNDAAALHGLLVAGVTTREHADFVRSLA